MLLHWCTTGDQHKAQQKMGPSVVSGLSDQRYLSVTKYETRGGRWGGHQHASGSGAAVSKTQRHAAPPDPHHYLTSGRIHEWPTCGENGRITPAFSGVPSAQHGEKIRVADIHESPPRHSVGRRSALPTPTAPKSTEIAWQPPVTRFWHPPLGSPPCEAHPLRGGGGSAFFSAGPDANPNTTPPQDTARQRWGWDPTGVLLWGYGQRPHPTPSHWGRTRS